MPKLRSFHLAITTGQHGRDDLPKYAINGFPLAFDETEGGCASGETFDGTGRPDSFPHSLHLIGPAEGQWDLATITVTYFAQDEEPYTYEFAPVTLDAESNLNIWKPRPAPVFDV